MVTSPTARIRHMAVFLLVRISETLSHDSWCDVSHCVAEYEAATGDVCVCRYSGQRHIPEWITHVPDNRQSGGRICRIALPWQ